MKPIHYERFLEEGMEARFGSRSFAENADLISADITAKHLHDSLDDLLQMAADDRRRFVEANQISLEEAGRKLFGLLELLRGMR